MGQSDQDVPLTHYNETKTVSVGAFYMDQTEITNNEYRQFVTGLGIPLQDAYGSRIPRRVFN